MALFTISASLLQLARPQGVETAAVLRDVTSTLTLLREIDAAYADRLETWVKDTLTLHAQTP